MPPRKRTRSKHPVSPKAASKPFRAAAESSESATDPKPTPRPPLDARTKKLEAVIIEALSEGVPVRPLCELITDYAQYWFGRRKLAQPQDVDLDVPVALGRDRMWYTKNTGVKRQIVSVQTGLTRAYTLQTQTALAYVSMSVVDRIRTLCIHPSGAIYFSTKNAIYAVTNSGSGCIAAHFHDSGGGNNGLMNFIPFGDIHSMASNHDGTALIVTDFENGTVSTLSLSQPMSKREIYNSHTGSPETGYMAIALDTSRRFGGIGMIYFTIDCGVRVTARREDGTYRRESIRRLIRINEVDGSEHHEVYLDPPPFDSLMFGMTCTPNGTIVLSNYESGSIYAIDPSNGVAECIKPYIGDHKSAVFTQVTRFYNPVMYCHETQSFVDHWEFRWGLHRCVLPLDLWDKPKLELSQWTPQRVRDWIYRCGPSVYPDEFDLYARKFLAEGIDGSMLINEVTDEWMGTFITNPEHIALIRKRIESDFK